MPLQHVIAFKPLPVGIAVTSLYGLLFALIFSIHLSVPPAPTIDVYASINQTQAWRDLQELSKDNRPWNSRRNSVIKDWLSARVLEIISSNDKTISIIDSDAELDSVNISTDVVLLRNDGINATLIGQSRSPPSVRYIESQNIMVYVRGTEDEAGAWWIDEPSHSHRGVLVNAHYDSVSSGYGATDDGVGVVSILQLISHFTTSGYTPRRGIIFLLNDGEEDGLYGAQTFAQHRWASFPDVFLNLEGAGSGGRAALFRSTDADVSSMYTSPHPFGTVLSADGFKRGLVRSDTDYTIFTKSLRIRGLDVAFVAPRSRYHTDQDGAKDTSKDSVWHMLSMALETTRRLTDHGTWSSLPYDTSSASTANTPEDLYSTSYSMMQGRSNSGVWFDILGSSFVVVTRTGFLTLCACVLIAGPIILGITVTLIKIRRRRNAQREQDIVQPRQTQHLLIDRPPGLSRTPLSLLVLVLVLAALAEWIAVQNPYVMYSSPFTLWTLFLTASALILWATAKVANHVRPSQTARWYAILWLYLLSWIFLVPATLDSLASDTGGGYPVLVFNFTTWLALMVGSLEYTGSQISTNAMVGEQADTVVVATGQAADEQTPLLATPDRTATLTGIVRPASRASTTGVLLRTNGTGGATQPSNFIWILQLLLMVPLNVILIGQIALFMITALHQTPADGNDTTTIIQAMTLLAVAIVAPVLPFIHKLGPLMPKYILAIFLYCLIWSTVAAPFSRDARLKYYFLQQDNLTSGTATISLTAIDPYLHDIIQEIPSADGRNMNCSEPRKGLRPGLTTCSWTLYDTAATSEHLQYSHTRRQVHYNITRVSSTTAHFSLQGTNTKSCRILFDSPLQDIIVEGGSKDKQNPMDTAHGATQVRLFSRTLDKVFGVSVEWPRHEKRRSGRIGCVWSELEDVAAAKDVKAFAPVWTAFTKHDDGLVEAWHDWEIVT